MPRRQQLVCQQLENIDRKALEDYQHLIRRYIKGRNGVYALYTGDQLYYVGLAKNLRSRLKSHLKDRHRDSWDRFSVYLTIGTNFLKEMESLLLRITQPPGNKIRGRFHRCQNLLRTFDRDIRTEQREQRDEIFGRIRPVTGDKTPPEERRPVLALCVSKSMMLRGKKQGQALQGSCPQERHDPLQKTTLQLPIARRRRRRRPSDQWLAFLAI